MDARASAFTTTRLPEDSHTAAPDEQRRAEGEEVPFEADGPAEHANPASEEAARPAVNGTATPRRQRDRAMHPHELSAPLFTEMPQYVLKMPQPHADNMPMITIIANLLVLVRWY